MAQVDPVSLLPIAGPSLSPLISQDQSATGEGLSVAASSQSGEEVNKQEKTQLQTGTEDDEVLFVFSAPRRRKKNRRRLEFSRSPSAIQERSGPLADLPASVETSATAPSARRGTAGMLEKLESCHIGSDNKNPILTRGNSLPIVQPPTLQQNPTLPLPDFDPTTEPNFAAMHDLPFPESSSMQWWNDPLPAPLLSESPCPDWIDVETEMTASNKRKRDMPEGKIVQLDSLDAQISPRTKPVTAMLPPITSSEDINMGNLDMVGRVNPQACFHSPQYLSPTMPSWSANWSISGRRGRGLQGSPYRRSSNTPLSLMRNSYKSLYQQPSYSNYPKGVFGQSSNNFQRAQGTTKAMSAVRTNQMYKPFGKHTYSSMGSHQRGFGETLLQGSVPTGTSPPYQLQQPPIISTDVRSPAKASIPKTANVSSGQRDVQNPNLKPPRLASIRTENPNDVLRKPSLYKIPPWPSPLTPSASQNVQSSTQPSISSNVSPGNNIHSNIVTAPRPAQIPSTPNFMHPRSNPIQMGRSSMNPQYPQTSRHVQSTSSSNIEQPPPRRGARKHSPNLIIDIAETCQELFPFAAIADRHSIPLQKVFDTFSAIIQLPLLRNADDKRRHGSLGKRRQKDFRDAKKAMEKAQAEEMNGERRRRGKGKEKEKEKESGLLRHAILNNVRESRGGV